MLAMQYSIHLPVNFDAALIHKRVNERKGFFDDHPGLAHKSFLYNEADKVYAPFYVWQDVDSAREFLLDDLFQGVTDTFSRHRVRSWFVIDMAYGNRDLKPTFAQRGVDIIPPEASLKRYVKREQELQSDLLKNPDLYMHLVALDAACWEILHFSLWKDKASALHLSSDSYLTYEVLHVTAPK
jgi:hypothetical protein